MKGSTIAVAVKLAVPASVRDVAGLPDWARRERYDITARPPAGTTPEQRQEMWLALFPRHVLAIQGFDILWSVHPGTLTCGTFAAYPNARSDARVWLMTDSNGSYWGS
jgi:hypothetical protein